MVDLPQHAAQISILSNYSNPDFGFQDQFELHWLIPYSFSYVLAVVLSKIAGIDIALKLIISLAVIFLPISAYVLVREKGGDPWWSLAGFPAAYGVSFYWGFLSHIVAIPVGIYLVTLAIRYARFPTVKKGVAVAAAAIFLFYAHAIVFAVCVVMAGLTVLCMSYSFSGALKRIAPLFSPLPFLSFWFFNPSSNVPNVNSWVNWAWRGLGRLLEVPLFMLSNWNDRWGYIMACLLILAIVIGGRLSELRWRNFIPWLAILALFIVVPHHAMDISFIYQRIAVFVFVFFLTLFYPSMNLGRIVLSRFLLLIGITFWMFIVIARFSGFNDEAKDFDVVMEAIPQNKSVLNLPFDRESAFMRSLVYAHLPAWVQAEKGGVYSFSFAYSFKSMARYQPGKAPLLEEEAYALENPVNFVWNRHNKFEYYVVRKRDDPAGPLFKGINVPVVLEAHKGWWWVYRKIG